MSKKEIPLNQLNLEQLSAVGKQVDQDIQSLSSSYTSLKVVMHKFKDNKGFIKDLQNSKEKEIIEYLSSNMVSKEEVNETKSLLENLKFSVNQLSNKISKIEDATGAGDAFWSGFLFGVLNKKSLAECVEIAQKIAVLKLENTLQNVDLNTII